jgi:hypothetical protein
VTPRPYDPWRLPTIRRFGVQLRELETGPRTPAIPWSGVSRRVILLSGAGIAAALTCILLILTSGRTAQARSVVNAAPAAAERSGTVRFRSVLTITVDGHPRAGITEQGAIDFASGAYSTTVRFGNVGQVLERRGVGGVFYAAERRPRAGPRPEHVRWIATPLQRGALSSESDAFTDPTSVFRALTAVRAPVRQVARQSLSGTPTTRYHLRTSLASFLEPSAGHIQNPLVYRRVQASLDVWIDMQGRPLRVDESFAGPSASGPTTMTTVVRFTGYGRPVSVPAPARSLVGPASATAPENPLVTAPGSLLARRLFFLPAGR